MDKPPAIFPWIEANQGLITLVALMLALIAFLMEQQRANREELHGKSEARRQEAIDRQRALDAADEAQKLRDEFEQNRLSEYVRAVHTLTKMLCFAVEKTLPTTNTPSSVWTAPVSLTVLATEVADSLSALIPTAMFSPSLLIATQKLVFLARAVGKMGQSDPYAANNNLNRMKQQLDEDLAHFEEVLEKAAKVHQ